MVWITVILQNKAGDDLTLLANASFTFNTAVVDGENYAVTISSQPIAQSCSITHGSGSISGSNVKNVLVDYIDLVSRSAGIFIESMSLYASSKTALGDVDGDLDLVTGTYGGSQPNAIYLNQST